MINILIHNVHMLSIKWLFSFIFIGLSVATLQAQIAVNESGEPAHPSAALDISSTEKGILIPRMTSAELSAVINPAEGLLVFQIDDPKGFIVFNDNQWTSINRSSASIPVGTVIEWWRPNADFPIPTGYKICDGSMIDNLQSPINGQTTPNMTDRFVVGTNDPLEAGDLLGSPTHTHNLSVSGNSISAFNHNHVFNYGTIYTNSGGNHVHEVIPSSGTLTSASDHSHAWANFVNSSKAWKSYNAAGNSIDVIDWGNGMDADGTDHFPIQMDILDDFTCITNLVGGTHNHTYQIPSGKYTSSNGEHSHYAFVDEQATAYGGGHTHPYAFGPVTSDEKSNHPKNTGLLKLIRIY